jgi:DNA damage-binding protein 1
VLGCCVWGYLGIVPVSAAATDTTARISGGRGAAAETPMSSSSSSFNYVATAHKPTNVTHSLVASFTSPDTLNLIVSRCTRIEIYALEAQGLVLLHDVPLYCRIATMELWRPAGKSTDRLFISTERYQFCILSYDERQREIVTEAYGDVRDRIGRPADAGQIAAIEPESRMIGLHMCAA